MHAQAFLPTIIVAICSLIPSTHASPPRNSRSDLNVRENTSVASSSLGFSIELVWPNGAVEAEELSNSVVLKDSNGNTIVTVTKI
jgi:hypothetical protein